MKEDVCEGREGRGVEGGEKTVTITKMAQYCLKTKY